MNKTRRKPTQRDVAKKKRIPIGRRDKLVFEERPGYVRRVVSDINKGQRVKMFQEAGWTIVQGHDVGGTEGAGSGTQVGSNVSQSVGGGITGILMEIPERYYKEDQKAKHDRINASEEQLFRKPTDALMYQPTPNRITRKNTP